MELKELSNVGREDPGKGVVLAVQDQFLVEFRDVTVACDYTPICFSLRLPLNSPLQVRLQNVHYFLLSDLFYTFRQWGRKKRVFLYLLDVRALVFLDAK